MTKRLLDADPVTGLMTFHEYDSLTDETTISYSADSTPVLELNKAMQNDAEFSKKGIKDGFWMYASIPVALQLKWLTEEKLDVYNPQHSDRLSKKLNDPEYAYLKTTTGHHKLKGPQ